MVPILIAGHIFSNNPCASPTVLPSQTMVAERDTHALWFDLKRFNRTKRLLVSDSLLSKRFDPRAKAIRW